MVRWQATLWQQRCLLGDEIEVCRVDGTVIAVVVWDGSLRH
jgi:hypothetical protein